MFQTWRRRYKNNPEKNDERTRPTGLTFRNTSKTRALGSPSGSLEHRCLFYGHWLIRGRLSQNKTGGLGRVRSVGWMVGSQKGSGTVSGRKGGRED